VFLPVGQWHFNDSFYNNVEPDRDQDSGLAELDAAAEVRPDEEAHSEDGDDARSKFLDFRVSTGWPVAF
jgi:hypothetical protein